ncbi:hypothetical protein B0T25DRAFT_219075 [Lasiosphaeria hispida]|uniref:Regulator of phospholipase D SRF1 n=1 Tax=Lasiosphaeria hispida TaxID=260671 RepID=A0AAJ0HJ40_9PEZI|nr:hypothetical protein B0T25DRAFT_219075 [Lasiosphaeria hispida]
MAVMTGAGSSPSTSHHSDLRASLRSRGTGAATPAAGGRRAPRSLPPWIDSYEVRYGAPTEDQLRVLENPPPRTLPPLHNHAPGPPTRRVSKDGFVYENLPAVEGSGSARVRLRQILTGKGGAERGRKWDHLRSAEPVIVPRYSRATPSSPWNGFLQSSRYGHLPNEESEIVDPEMLDKLQPSFNNPVDVPRPTDTTRSRAARTTMLYKRMWQVILRHPLVPLAFRLIVLLTSIVALALSARIFEIESGERSTSAETTQSIVAIVVDTLAIPYIGYMTWDEYTGKPLGLRPATQKISLVLMDLFFIIFKSASTTLAFEALVYHNVKDIRVRQYSQALAAFQTVSLISWSMTFTVNVFRLVQKLGGGDEDGS